MSDVDATVSRRSTIGRGATLKRAVTEAHKLLDDLLAADMAKLGLSIGEADVLTVVELCEYPPVPSEIADWLSLTGAGATGRLNTLERRGLIERLPHPTDGRSVTIHLTPAGSKLAEAVVDAKDAAIMSTLVDRVGDRATDDLITTLDELIAAARAVIEETGSG